MKPLCLTNYNMSRITGTVTFGTLGIKTISVGFQPTWAEFRVCQKVATPQAFTHLSLGGCTPTAQNVTSTFQDTAGGTSVNDLTKVVSHFERDGSGNIIEVLSASFDSFTATALKVNVTIGNPNYQVILTCGT
jgi:hypothetical protein